MRNKTVKLSLGVHLILGLFLVNAEILDMPKEYCMESFTPNCAPDQVIIMQNAVYGRMKLGRCVKKDYGVLGCSSNELGSLDKLCSGLPSCNLVIPSPELTSRLSCIGELNPYLEAGYKCQKVYSPNKKSCHIPEKVSVPRTAGFIASSESVKSECGLHESPWVLEAKPGQQIKISLLDFDWDNTTDMDENCKVNYGYILDLESDDVINICGRGAREKVVFTSVGHEVQIVLNAENVQKYRFLIKYEASGCPQYNPPRYAWVKEEDGSLVIGCDYSENTWKVHCASNTWLGVIGNCTPPPFTVNTDVSIITESSKSSDKPIESGSQSFTSHNHVVAFSVGCVTVFGCCIVVFVGIYCIRRHELNAQKNIDHYSLPPTLQRLRNDSQSISNVLPYRVIGTTNSIPILATNQLPPYPNTTLPVPKDTATAARPGQRQRLHSYNSDGGQSHVYMAPHQHDNLGSVVDDNNSVVFYHVLENGAETALLGNRTTVRSNSRSDSASEQLYQSINFNTIV